MNRPALPMLALWVLVCTAAELVGIGAGALWWVGMDQINPAPVVLSDQLVMLVLKAVSGVVEGLILGFAQGWVLRRFFPKLRLVTFAAATCAVGVLGWALGSVVPIFLAQDEALAGVDAATAADPPLILYLGFACLFGIMVGALFGGVQALVLRHAADRSRYWIAGNSAGWGLGMPVIFWAGSSVGSDNTAEIFLYAAGSGVAAGLLVGLSTAVAILMMAPTLDPVAKA